MRFMASFPMTNVCGARHGGPGIEAYRDPTRAPGPRSLDTVITKRDARTPPALWPLPVPHCHAYATTDDLWFGWPPARRGRQKFAVVRVGALRNSVLAEWPLTESGWKAAWGRLLRDFPQLAEAVADRSEAGANRLESEDERRLRAARVQDLLARLGPDGLLDRLPGSLFLGGHGGDLVTESRHDLYFTADRLLVTAPGDAIALLESPYATATALEIGGPGTVTKGGGYIGAAPGVVGMMEAHWVAGRLNSATSRTEIQTTVHWQADGLDLFWRTAEATPADLQIRMAAVRSRLRGPVVSVPTPDATADPVSQLERLVALRRDGVLTDDEFALMKQKIVAGGPGAGDPCVTATPGEASPADR
jgi:hypothetical protein